MGKWFKIDSNDLDSAAGKTTEHFARKDDRKKKKVKGAENAFLNGYRTEETLSGKEPDNTLSAG